MKTFTTVVLACLLSVTASLAGAEPINTIRGSDAASADQPPLDLAYVGGRPGSQKLLTRMFNGQPPLVPHAIASFDEEITATDNPCLECHISNEFKGKKMPRVSDSHLVPGKKASDGSPVLDMMLWQCNNCHVPQVAAKPLVENTFRGNAGKR